MTGNPARRIEILKELGADVTPEREAREYQITLDSVARIYGENWEQDADAIHNLISELHPVDQAQAVEREIDAELEAQHADWLDEQRTLHEASY